MLEVNARVKRIMLRIIRRLASRVFFWTLIIINLSLIFFVNLSLIFFIASKKRVLIWGNRVLTWGRRVPASAFAWQGSMPWQANTIHFLIAKLGDRTPTWQYRRGDASPPGEDTIPPSSDEDASSSGKDAPTKTNTHKKSLSQQICWKRLVKKLAATYSPAGVQYHRRGWA